MKKGLLNFAHGVFMFVVAFGATAYWLDVFLWILNSL